MLLTNGRIFSVREYCDLLKSTLPEQTLIGIPLHGYSSDTHDRITRAPGSFKQTIVGLKNLLAQGNRIELRIVISKLSAPYINEIAKLVVCEFPGVETVKIIGLEMLGNAAKYQEEVWIPYQEAFQKSKKAIMTLISAGIDVGIYNFPLCAVEKEFWPICEKSITGYKVRFPEVCSSCIVKDACGGLFAGTYRLAQNDVAPIRGDSDAKLF